MGLGCAVFVIMLVDRLKNVPPSMASLLSLLTCYTRTTTVHVASCSTSCLITVPNSASISCGCLKFGHSKKLKKKSDLPCCVYRIIDPPFLHCLILFNFIYHIFLYLRAQSRGNPLSILYPHHADVQTQTEPTLHPLFLSLCPAQHLRLWR